MKNAKLELADVDGADEDAVVWCYRRCRRDDAHRVGQAEPRL
jgi:hypothetical protein